MDKAKQRQQTSNAESWLDEMLHQRWDSYRERLKDCRQDPSSEAVHELRVATRRLISQLSVISGVLCEADTKAGKILKRQLDALSALRDAQMQRSAVELWKHKFRGLRPYVRHLKDRERQLLKVARKDIRGFRAKRVKKEVLCLREQIELGEPTLRSASRQMAAVWEAASQAFAEVVRRRGLIDLMDLSTVHRTRVAFKKFRYIAETLPTHVTGWTGRDLRRLAFYQRKMGSIQDLEVIQEAVADFRQKHPKSGKALNSLLVFLGRCQKAALWAFTKSVDDLSKFWPPPRPCPSR